MACHRLARPRLVRERIHRAQELWNYTRARRRRAGWWLLDEAQGQAGGQWLLCTYIVTRAVYFERFLLCELSDLAVA